MEDRSMTDSIFDLGTVEKSRLAFIAWECENGHDSSDSLQSALRRLGFAENYIQGITSGSDLSYFHFEMPIFSMAEVKDYFKVPEQIRNLCAGPTDGFYSDVASGNGNKWVCQYITGDHTLFFCFGRPHEKGKSDSEYSGWEFHAFILKDGDDWYVGPGGDSAFFKEVYGSVGPMIKRDAYLSTKEIIEKYDMEKTDIRMPLNFC
jgi:hypothetical protein